MSGLTAPWARRTRPFASGAGPTDTRWRVLRGKSTDIGRRPGTTIPPRSARTFSIWSELAIEEEGVQTLPLPRDRRLRGVRAHPLFPAVSLCPRAYVRAVQGLFRKASRPRHPQNPG